MGQLEGKVAVITGAASGMGAAAALLFSREGAHVVLADLNGPGGEASAQTASEAGQRCVFQRTDVSAEADIQALVGRALSEFGRLDVMFNNAGIGGAVGSLEGISVEDWDRTQAVCLRGVFLGIKHAARVMREQRSGSIISTASVAGVDTSFGPHVYDTAKAAVIHLTKSVAKELGDSNIRVNCICPGFIATPIFAKSHGLASQVADQTVEPVKEWLAQVQPIPRAGVPEDIAHAALWLAGDESTFVSGHALVVDGALLAGRRWADRQKLREDMRTALGVSD